MGYEKLAIHLKIANRPIDATDKVTKVLSQGNRAMPQLFFSV